MDIRLPEATLGSVVDSCTLAATTGQIQTPRSGFQHTAHVLKIRRKGSSTAAVPAGGGCDPGSNCGTEGRLLGCFHARMPSEKKCDFLIIH